MHMMRRKLIPLPLLVNLLAIVLYPNKQKTKAKTKKKQKTKKSNKLKKTSKDTNTQTIKAKQAILHFVRLIVISIAIDYEFPVIVQIVLIKAAQCMS